MKQLIIILVLAAASFAGPARTSGQSSQGAAPKKHMAVIREVLQTSQYTYLHVKVEKGMEWFAVPLSAFRPGDTCYYQEGGLVMPDFTSKELKKTFDKVIFLEGVSTTPGKEPKPEGMAAGHKVRSKPAKIQVKIDPVKGGITIAELFRNKESYKDKVVKIRGQVTKFSAHIMGKNWVHLQDGTAFGEKFDVTATVDATLNVGDVVTIESKVTLNKDFGSGYFFDVILENAVIK